MSWGETIPLLLAAVLVAVRVALPATFTLATALGARSLAKLDVLSTRLSAVDEAANMDLLCSDKIGTLTRNELSVNTVRPMPRLQRSACPHFGYSGQCGWWPRPFNAAVRAAAKRNSEPNAPKLIKFIPFDPANKVSEASATAEAGKSVRLVKGAFGNIAKLTHHCSRRSTSEGSAAVDELKKRGFRVLAMAAGSPSKRCRSSEFSHSVIRPLPPALPSVGVFSRPVREPCS